MKLEDSSHSKSFAELLTPYLFAFQRYWKLAFGPAIVIALLTVLVSRKWPDYFKADAKISISTPKVTSDLVDNLGQAEMLSRLEAIVQEILSRPRLRGIIKQHNLYTDIKGPGSAEAAMKTLRDAVTINQVRSETGASRNYTYSSIVKGKTPGI